MIELQLQTTAFGWKGARTPDDLTVCAATPANEIDLYLSIQDLFAAHAHLITESEVKDSLGTNVLFEFNPMTDTVIVTSSSFNAHINQTDFLEELESVMHETFDEVDRQNSREERAKQLQNIQEHLSGCGFAYNVLDQYERLKYK